MLKFRKVRLSKPVPIIKLVPNFLTLIGLVIGISAIRFAIDARWESAVYCTLIAAIIDGLDGRIARLLNATSPFGAEFDSLSDFANFGVAPAFTIYLWSYQQYEFKLLSWSIMMLFIACMAIRLARFNTSISQPNQDKKSYYFFTGVPAPCGALLALIPIILDFKLSEFPGIEIRPHTVLIDLYITVIACLLASRLPTISFRNIHIKPEYLSLVMTVSAILIIITIIYPWYSLPALAIIYIISIPVCSILNKKLS